METTTKFANPRKSIVVKFIDKKQVCSICLKEYADKEEFTLHKELCREWSANEKIQLRGLLIKSSK